MVRLSAGMVTVPAVLSVAGVPSVPQASALPPATASYSPTCVSVPTLVVNAKRSGAVLRCAPLPVKATGWRA
jgi:hypothetical protein